MRNRSIAAGYRLVWAVVRWLPERLTWAVFRLVADCVWCHRGRGVRQLETNLARVVGSEVSPARLRELSRAGLRSYLRYWLEVLRLPVMPGSRVLSQASTEGVEKVFTALGAGRGVVLALPHMGNWDHAGAWMVRSGAPFTTVVERLRPESVYNRFVALRTGLGMEVLAHTATDNFGTLGERLRAGRLVCLLADRDLTGSGVEVDFFGEPARIPAGPAALAADTGAALMPVTLWYEGRRWRIRVHEEIPVPATGTRVGRVAAMTQAMVREFEQGIAARPQDWHMLQRLWVADVPVASRRPGQPAGGE